MLLFKAEQVRKDDRETQEEILGHSDVMEGTEKNYNMLTYLIN